MNSGQKRSFIFEKKESNIQDSFFDEASEERSRRILLRVRLNCKLHTFKVREITLKQGG